VSNVFLLDANVFIEPYRGYYAFDIAPGFWTSLVKSANNKYIQSIDKVKEELKVNKEDALLKWVEENLDFIFKSTKMSEIVQKYNEIIEWVVNNDQFLDYAKDDFAAGADGWLIAYAAINNECIIVTHESLNWEIKKKVPIPNVCEEFGVPYIVSVFQMLRELGVELILK